MSEICPAQHRLGQSASRFREICNEPLVLHPSLFLGRESTFARGHKVETNKPDRCRSVRQAGYRMLGWRHQALAVQHVVRKSKPLSSLAIGGNVHVKKLQMIALSKRRPLVLIRLDSFSGYPHPCKEQGQCGQVKSNIVSGRLGCLRYPRQAATYLFREVVTIKAQSNLHRRSHCRW